MTFQPNPHKAQMLLVDEDEIVVNRGDIEEAIDLLHTPGGVPQALEVLSALIDGEMR